MSEVIVEQPQAIPTPGEWTYEDYLVLPDDGRRYEIIEGVLYVVNAPNSDHQTVVTETSRHLGNFVASQNMGRVLVAPFEVHLSSRTRPIQPDILFIRSERWPIERIAYFAGAPDLVVEVISPSSTRMDRVTKFTTYESAGVPEYWIVNPHARTIEVFTLSHGEYALLGEYTDDETVESAVLEGINLVASTVFE